REERRGSKEESKVNRKGKKKKEVKSNSREDRIVRKRVRFADKAAVKLGREDESIIIGNIRRYIVIAKE
ncbi:hypothetical protein OFB65_25240, partial [Escherichia coli]|nr:hypothetical protein [Escherichia coli]